jgi:hypothetical protein
MADLSNNPFIDHSASVVSRFPNIDPVSSSPSGPSTLQYSASWQQQQQRPTYQSSGFVGTNPTGYSQPYYQQQQQWPQQQQQQQQYQAQLQPPYSPTSYQSSPSPYGQQFVGQVNPSTTGYPQSQMQAQYTGYPSQQPSGYSYQQQQQQQPQQPSYGYPPQQQHYQQQLLAQFDPYTNLGQQLLSPTGSAATPTATTGALTGASGLPPGVQHPRTFIHSHKTELEAWDPQTWKQVQSSFEALKVAWEARKRAAESQVRALGGTVGAPATGFFGSSIGAYGAYGGGVYQPPQSQEIDRLNAVPSPSSYPHPCFDLSFYILQLIKEADSNIGTPFVPCL